ncbi:hypothetical protein ACRAWF_43525 [Streptomyces sp. L7]
MAAITPGSLVAHGHELFKNSYVVEGLSLPGTFATGSTPWRSRRSRTGPGCWTPPASTWRPASPPPTVPSSSSPRKVAPVRRQRGTHPEPAQAARGAGQHRSGVGRFGLELSQTAGKSYKGPLQPVGPARACLPHRHRRHAFRTSTGVNRTPTESGDPAPGGRGRLSGHRPRRFPHAPQRCRRAPTRSAPSPGWPRPAPAPHTAQRHEQPRHGGPRHLRGRRSGLASSS